MIIYKRSTILFCQTYFDTFVGKNDKSNFSLSCIIKLLISEPWTNNLKQPQKTLFISYRSFSEKLKSNKNHIIAFFEFPPNWSKIKMRFKSTDINVLFKWIWITEKGSQLTENGSQLSENGSRFGLPKMDLYLPKMDPMVAANILYDR